VYLLRVPSGWILIVWHFFVCLLGYLLATLSRGVRSGSIPYWCIVRGGARGAACLFLAAEEEADGAFLLVDELLLLGHEAFLFSYYAFLLGYERVFLAYALL